MLLSDTNTIQLTSAFLESRQHKIKTLKAADSEKLQGASGSFDSLSLYLCVCVCVCVCVLLQTNVFIIQTFSAAKQRVSQRNHGDGAFTNERSLRMGAPSSSNKSVCAQRGGKQAAHSSNHQHVCMCRVSPLSPLEQQQWESIQTIKPSM